MEEEKIVLDENQEIEKNLLRDRAKKADDITDEKYNLCNKINRDMVEEYFSVIHKYLKEQENINEDVLNKAEAIEKFLKELQRKYEFITKEK